MANRLNDFGLPVEQIAQALNADVSMVQEWLAEPQLPKEQKVGRKDKNSEILPSFIEVRIFFRIFCYERCSKSVYISRQMRKDAGISCK